MVTIKRSDLQKIHNIACSTWKNRIEQYALRTPFNDIIELNDVEVDAMFNAADNSQTKVLIEVFGERKEQIDWNRIKTGSKVMIQYTGQHCNGITGINLDEPVNVVFYNTPHLINEDNVSDEDKIEIKNDSFSYIIIDKNMKFLNE
jgi:hypothetical protein